MATRSNRRTRHRAAGLAMLVVALGCGGTTDPPPRDDEFGQYTLLSVNDQSLPVTLSTNIGSVVVQGATLQLAAASSGNPTYTASVSGSQGNQQQVILADAGTYVRTGTTLTFTSTTVPNFTYVGFLNNTRLSVTVPGAAVGASGAFTLVFHRQ